LFFKLSAIVGEESSQTITTATATTTTATTTTKNPFQFYPTTSLSNTACYDAHLNYSSKLIEEKEEKNRGKIFL